ncbi:MAG: VCBS repeat-containing protein [Phycisphaerae bacterium]|nr:VCBS repeat-containing protein [Phycisphaerae bacterium]
MRRSTWFMVAAVAVILGGGSTSYGLINPNFTPIHLAQQADTILKVTIKPTAKAGIVELNIESAYKPKEKAPTGKLLLDLTAAPHKAKSEAVAKVIADNPKAFALVFAGEFHEECAEGGGRQMPDGFLHIAGRWLSLFRAKGSQNFEMSDIDTAMEATWAGSTDMLDKAVDYVLTDKSPAIPSTAEATWDKNGKCGNVPGKVSYAMPVDLGAAAQGLFVGSDAGDKLFVHNAKAEALVDVTAKVKLTSKSAVAVWGDFDRNGKNDLASWDGKALSLHLQQADGTFTAKPIDTGDALKAGVVSLTVIDGGKDGVPALLAGTPSAAVVLVQAGDGKMTGTALGLAAPTTQKDTSPTAGQCLAADLDGDGLADVLQLFSMYSVFYKGKAVGEFDKGVRTNVCLGEGRSKACLGDFDGDGLLDIFCVAEDGTRLWQNNGKLNFEDLRGTSGEIAYISKPGGIDTMTCDVNNDGRQDLFIAYSAQTPLLFFNRGWRSTGHAHDLDLQEKGLLPAAEEGQAGGCVADFNGDGAQDMVIVLKNGDVHTFYRKVYEDENALSITACLAGNGPVVGPMTVTAFHDKRCLGAWAVTAGSSNAFWGLRSGGNRTIQWQMPGGKTEQKDVKVVSEAVRLVIEPKK